MKKDDNSTFFGYLIWGSENQKRIESRKLEEKIQENVNRGYHKIEVRAFGQHGIGGRLWCVKDEKVHIKITGYSGQRTGSMGFPNTFIEIMGPASDDVGWLNAGAEILVHGNAANGAANAMAQGKIFVDGNIGSRGMTMTKQNPRYEPPELWVLGSVGDYFAEFMAGGIAVICGYNPQNPEDILGYRPCVGMVGGKIFFRGPYKGFSQADAKIVPIDDNQWQWLINNIENFLKKIKKTELLSKLTNRNEWQLITARSPKDKYIVSKLSMKEFREKVWNKELGKGGIIGDIINEDTQVIPLITTGNLRRYIPVWENKKYLAPCQSSCPTGIPVHERWKLIREGKMDEAIDLALAYTPFPATVCGYLCPNLCMNGCTRKSNSMTSVDITELGKLSINANTPQFPELTGDKVAVIGGGVGGISVAWHLRMSGIEAVIYDKQKKLGGKLTSVIPDSRIPVDVIEAEINRIHKIIPHINLKKDLSKIEIKKLSNEYKFVIIASGANKPKTLPITGSEKISPANTFLENAKNNNVKIGKKVVIIGAGNVGCDVATEAHRLGASEITLIDVQQPLAFGKEKQDAEKIGAIFRWPCFTKEITDDGVILTNGELIPADNVFISIGEHPDLSFIPDSVKTENGFIKVNEIFQTSDPKIFAIGDVIKPGLLTDAIGAGRIAAQAINNIIKGSENHNEPFQQIDISRVKTQYCDPRLNKFDDVFHCSSECLSCGTCRDCGICENICPQGAISRNEINNGKDFEMIVNSDKCIGCGFCADSCPCGIWCIQENIPLEQLSL